MTHHNGRSGRALAATPALANVGTLGLLAHGVQAESTQVLLDSGVRLSARNRVLEEAGQTGPLVSSDFAQLTHWEVLPSTTRSAASGSASPETKSSNVSPSSSLANRLFGLTSASGGLAVVARHRDELAGTYGNVSKCWSEGGETLLTARARRRAETVRTVSTAQVRRIIGGR